MGDATEPETLSQQEEIELTEEKRREEAEQGDQPQTEEDPE